MGNYQAYEQYKDPRIEWLDDIPEHWDVKRIKFTVNIKYGLGEPPESLEDGLPIIRATDIYRGVIDGSKVQRVNPDKVPWSRNSELKSGDILIVRSGAYTGDSAIVTKEWEGAIAGYDMVLTPISSHPKYIAWNLLAKHVLEGQLFLAKSRAAQPHLNAEELGDTIIAYPPLEEQETIARFLDYKTEQIDQLIAKKEALLEKLDEKRTALIIHAVTKGLDPTTPMKDSGIEWLGDIPEHWKTGVKLLRLAEEKKHSFVNGPFGSDLLTSELKDEGVPVIYSGDVKPFRFSRKSEKYVTEEKAYQLNFCRVDAGDLLLAKVGGSPGDASIYLYLSSSGIVTQDVVRIKLDRQKIVPEYLVLLMNSKVGKFVVKLISVEATRSRFSLGDFKGLRFHLPPLDEQQEISKYGEEIVQEINQQQAKILEAIKKLKEYRTALITNAVTGKIDVRGISIPQS